MRRMLPLALLGALPGLATLSLLPPLWKRWKARPG